MQAQAEDPRELIATCEEGLQMELTPAQEGDGWQVRIYRKSSDGINRMVDQWMCRETEQRDARQIAEYILSGTAEHRLNDQGVEGLIPLAAHHINEYHEKQAYGGPEEGGWYFNAGIYIRCLGTYATKQEADERALMLQDYIQELNSGAWPLTSVLSAGLRRILVEPHPGRDYPSCRPHYE